MAYLMNPSAVSSAMLIPGKKSIQFPMSNIVEHCHCFFVFFYLINANVHITLNLLCLLLLFALSRYKNPVDIPVGNSRQKIKSLKARVCISKIN